MKNEHITEILDEKKFGELAAHELLLVNSHCAACPDCRKAFEAAQFSSVLLGLRAESPAVEPSPFFQAKVMNALRESQSLRKPIATFRRWWQASYAVVMSLLLVVAGLVALTIFAPSSIGEEAQAGVPSNLYPTDAVILNQRTSRELTDEQVFQVIYNPRYESGKK